MKKSFFAVIAIVVFCTIGFGQTQAELNEIEHTDYLKVEKELNNVYNKILKEYKTDTVFKKNFRAAQKVWLKLRDAEMQVKFPDTNNRRYGSVLPMCWWLYLAELTQSRIEYLKAWIDGTEEGDNCAGSIKINSRKELP
jgi:uncharacterized protein YecT (DUF1311 family)